LISLRADMISLYRLSRNIEYWLWAQFTLHVRRVSCLRTLGCFPIGVPASIGAHSRYDANFSENGANHADSFCLKALKCLITCWPYLLAETFAINLSLQQTPAICDYRIFDTPDFADFFSWLCLRVAAIIYNRHKKRAAALLRPQHIMLPSRYGQNAALIAMSRFYATNHFMISRLYNISARFIFERRGSVGR
jgi:hypothetical protein